MEPIKIILDLYIHDDFCDDHPTHIRATIDEDLYDRIKKSKTFLNEITGIRSVDIFDYPDFLNNQNEDEELKEWEGRTEGDVLQVDNYGISWKSYLKNTNICMTSESFSFEILDLLVEIPTMDASKIPLLLHHKEPMIVEAAKKRAATD